MIFNLILFLTLIIIVNAKNDEANSLEKFENLINLVDTRLDVVEKMSIYKYLEGLSVRSVVSEYGFLYNAYTVANNSHVEAYFKLWSTYGGPQEIITYQDYLNVIAPSLEKITQTLVKSLKEIEPITYTKQCPRLLQKAKANLLQQNKIDNYLAPARAESLYVALGSICNIPNRNK